MTDSELFAVMCGGLASVAGSVLAGYASMGVKMEYLIAASFAWLPRWSAVRQAAGTGNRDPRATTRTPQKVSWTTSLPT